MYLIIYFYYMFTFKVTVEKTEGASKNEQPRDTGNIGYTTYRETTKQTEWTVQRHWLHCVHNIQGEDKKTNKQTENLKDGSPPTTEDESRHPHRTSHSCLL